MPQTRKTTLSEKKTTTVKSDAEKLPPNLLQSTTVPTVSSSVKEQTSLNPDIKTPTKDPGIEVDEVGLYKLRNDYPVIIIEIDPHGSLAYDATGQAWSCKNGIFVHSHTRDYDIVSFLCNLPDELKKP